MKNICLASVVQMTNTNIGWPCSAGILSARMLTSRAAHTLNLKMRLLHIEETRYNTKYNSDQRLENTAQSSDQKPTRSTEALSNHIDSERSQRRNVSLHKILDKAKHHPPVPTQPAVCRWRYVICSKSKGHDVENGCWWLHRRCCRRRRRCWNAVFSAMQSYSR
jgi:hypothetical protein